MIKRDIEYKYTYFSLIMIFLQKQISNHQFQWKEKKKQYHVHQQVKFNRPSSTKCVHQQKITWYRNLPKIFENCEMHSGVNMHCSTIKDIKCETSANDTSAKLTYCKNNNNTTCSCFEIIFSTVFIIFYSVAFEICALLTFHTLR